MGQLVRQHKIIPISWACPVFTVALDLVGMNIKNRDMQFVTPNFLPPYL